MTIKVGLYEMDERSASRLRIVFKMVYKNQCEAVDIEDADTVIVNIEKQNPQQTLEEFKSSYPNKPIILLYDKELNIDGVKSITRPCKLPDLLALIKDTSESKKSNSHSSSAIKQARKVADSLQKKLRGHDNRKRINVVSNPKISTEVSSNEQITTKEKTSQVEQSLSVELKNSANLELSKAAKTIVNSKLIKENYYQPDNFLQGKVTSAIKKANNENKSVFLRCWSHRWIVVSPSSGFLVENIKERQLSNLGLVNTDSDVVFREETFTEKQMAAMAETPTEEIKATPIQKFIWDIAVRTARGRIPEGTNCEDNYLLEQWPNLTRISRVANSMRISAFWLDQPQSINDVIRQLNIPAYDVYTYFSAAIASGLLIPAKRRGDKLIKPVLVTNDQQKSGLFSAIFRKLNKISKSIAGS
jgi:hypothetical protein